MQRKGTKFLLFTLVLLASAAAAVAHHGVATFGELTTPNMLTRRGWNKDTLKPGDQITMIGNQSKDGSPGMRVQNVTTSDGRTLDPNGTDY